MAAGSTYTPIATVTTSGSQSTVTFSSIPSTYTDLVFVCSVKNTVSPNDLWIQVNGDTGNNYSRTYLVGDGSSAGSARQSSAPNAQIGGYIGTGDGMAVIQLMNYSNTTTNKTFLSRAGSAAINTGALVALWRNTAAINSVNFGWAGGAFANGSTLTLYGIAAA